jgi:hypothetical protein
VADDVAGNALPQALAVGVARGRPVILTGTLAVAAASTDAGLQMGQTRRQRALCSDSPSQGMKVYSRDGSIMVKTPSID